ncbi:DNA/RNA polymerases superfamily protein [Gossypium australe]|uniref:DNA/RNA polymerases superfamily protein n=1 Tax=Gossypium australe TaxID=47621 RepID=A0A5B6W8S8_9ROSI|nr:DNA/RNA polymerases superfamily protein [Gossypium australe]
MKKEITKFVSGLPTNTSMKNVVWIIVDQLTKSAHFVAVQRNYLLEKLMELYISKIVRLHCISFSIYLPLTELAYNNSYHANLGMPPFKALYGRKCRSSICWMKLGEKNLVGLNLVCETK